MSSNTKKLKSIPLDRISFDINQPRLHYSLTELQQQTISGNKQAKIILSKITSLSASILEIGLITPISIYPTKNNQYTILDGHRRYLAVSLLQHETIQCYIIPTPSKEDILLNQLNTDTQHEQYNIFELAKGCKRLYEYIKEKGGTIKLIDRNRNIQTIEFEPNEPNDKIWSIIEEKIGISTSRRYQIQSVLKLPLEIQQMAESNSISENRIRFLVPLNDKKVQKIIIKEIGKENLSNIKIRERIKELQDRPLPNIPKPENINSAIRHINRLVKRFDNLENIPRLLSGKDPRTVKSYKKLLPKLREAINDMVSISEKLEFLEK